MAVDEVVNASWSRKHDMPGTGFHAAKIVYPTSLEDLIEICSNRLAGTHLKAAGSHWALSDAAISDDVFIETHDPDNVFTAMSRTLYDVVPNCLNTAFIDLMARRHPPVFGDDADTSISDPYYLIHIETGKRIYQLYAELDQGDDANPDSLAWYIDNHYSNDSYHGPWAFRTLGGAGGQTIFGALTTGTHGGDFQLPPIADDVMAMHLVADGGKHYWIERLRDNEDVPLTDDERLRAVYNTRQYRSRDHYDNFGIIRDDDLFNAVLISAGRFGVVYSIVLRAVRQYSLHEERRLNTWQDIKGLVGDPDSTLYSGSRFLQIALCLTPHDNFQKNLCGVTRRWNVAPLPNATNPNGRRERVGHIVTQYDPQIQGPRFEFAGNSFVYSPDPHDPNKAASPSYLERACADADIIKGVIEVICDELRTLIEDDKVLIGSVIAAVVTPGASGALLALIAPLAIILAVLLAILDALRAPGESRRLGELMNELKNVLLNRDTPGERAAGLFVWQLMGSKSYLTNILRCPT